MDGFEMRASLIIASHNEGEALAKTIESCIETCAHLDYEILVADDASTDGSVADALRRFSQIRLYRHEQRQGVSATKALGGRHARGEVLVFLDAHTKAEHGAIIRLVAAVAE
jgi:glycosyltransferase involved in cell wall biosynthesis